MQSMCDTFRVPNEFLRHVEKILTTVRKNDIRRSTRWKLPATIDVEYFMAVTNHVLQREGYIWRVVRTISVVEDDGIQDRHRACFLWWRRQKRCVTNKVTESNEHVVKLEIHSKNKTYVMLG